MTDEQPKCTVCGHPMPEGEGMFQFHGYSGPCPGPPLDTPPPYMKDGIINELRAQLVEMRQERDTYKAEFTRALCCVDEVFQKCAEHPNPILDGYVPLGTDKFEAVKKLAHDYLKLRQLLREGFNLFYAIERRAPSGEERVLIRNWCNKAFDVR